MHLRIYAHNDVSANSICNSNPAFNYKMAEQSYYTVNVIHVETHATYENITKYKAEKITGVPAAMIDLAVDGYVLNNQICKWRFIKNSTTST